MQRESHTPLYSIGEEIAHALTHGVGLLLSIAGLLALLVAASLRGNVWHITGCAVFGGTLVLLYGASTLYHAIQQQRAKRAFQRLDHAAIFLLIAGTYTPFVFSNLLGTWGWMLLGIVWSLAILGIVLEQVLSERAERFSMLLYLVMGWLIVFAIGPLANSVRPEGLALLVSGGLAYTLGVIFYAWRQLPFNHAVWHVFVMAGSACHFSCVFVYVIPPTV